MPTLFEQPNVDGNIELTVTELDSETRLTRFQSNDVLHHEAKVLHPDHSGVMKGGGSLFPVSGEMTVTWYWSEAENSDTANSLDAWKAMVDRADITISEDLENRQVSATINGDYNHSDWVSHPFEYVPNSSAGRLTGSNSVIACLTRLSDPTSWTTQYKHSDAATTITKSGTTCYVYCSAPVTVGGTEYPAHKLFNLTSDSVTITPEGRCLFVKVSK